MDVNSSLSDPASTDADRVCVHCGRVVNPDRERLCNHCGLPFRAHSAGAPPGEQSRPSKAMHKDVRMTARAITAVRNVLLGVLVVAWIATWLALHDSEAKAAPASGIPSEVLLSGFAMCAAAGALARFAGRRRMRDGAGAGVLMIVTYLVGHVAIQLMVGSDIGLAQGESPFSFLIELPFWLGGPFGLGAVLGLAGYVAAQALAGGPETQSP